MTAHRVPFDIFRGQVELPDPGASGTITVERNPCFVSLVSATAESRTLARPTRVGGLVALNMKTDGGDITLTVTGGYNENGSTVFTFNDAGQFAVFLACYDGTNYFWRLISHYGIGNDAPLGSLVVAAGSTLTLTAALHAGKIINLDQLAGSVVTLPAAAGTGNRYRFIVSVLATSNSHVIKVANSSDAMCGIIQTMSDDPATMKGFAAVAGTSDTITLNRTTTGSVTVGEYIEIVDVATNLFLVQGVTSSTGTEATPFSNAV